MWKSLKYSDLTDDGTILDTFGFEKYKLEVGDWVTDSFNCNYNSVEFEIECHDIAGSGTLKYQESIDRINWTAVQANATDVVLAITTDEVHRIKDFATIPNSWKRLELDEGTLSAGYLIIKVTE